MNANREIDKATLPVHAARATDGGSAAIEVVHDLGLLIVIAIGAIAPVPNFYVDVQATRLFGVPIIIILTLSLGVVAHFVLTKTRFGRSVYATGGNPVAARLAGIRVNRIIVLAYTISGLLAALGGL